MIDPSTGLDIPDANDTAAEALGTLGGGGASPFPMPSPYPDDYPSIPGGAPGIPAPVQSPPVGGVNPALAGNLGQQRDLAAQQSALTEQQGGINTQGAEIGADLEHERALEARMRAQDIADAEEAHQRYIADSQKGYQDAVAKKREADAAAGTDYFAGRGTGARVGAGIEIALGGLGAALQNAAAAQLGHVGNAQNTGLQHVQRLMDEDYRRKRHNVEAASDALVRAHTGIADARTARLEALKAIDVEHGATWSAVEDQFRARAAQLKIPASQIETSQAMLHIQQQRAEAEQRAIGEAVKLKQQNDLVDKRMRFQEGQANRRASMTADREDARAARDDAKAGIKARGSLDSEFKNAMTATGLQEGKSKGLLHTNRALTEMLEAVKSNNPLLAKEAFLRFDATARGGSATQGSIDELTKTLGGTTDQIAAMLAKAKDGGWPKGFKERFEGAVAHALDQNVAQIGNGHQALVDRFYGDEYGALKGNVEGQMATIFHPVRDRNGEQVFKVSPDATATSVDYTGKRVRNAAAPTAPAPAPAAASPHPPTIPMGGGASYQMGADGNYHLVH